MVTWNDVIREIEAGRASLERAVAVGDELAPGSDDYDWWWGEGEIERSPRAALLINMGGLDALRASIAERFGWG